MDIDGGVMKRSIMKCEIELDAEVVDNLVAKEIMQQIQYVHADLKKDKFWKPKDKIDAKEILPALIEVWKYFSVYSDHSKVEKYEI